MRESNASAIAANDARLALLNGGVWRVYTGAPPSTVEAAATGTVLCEGNFGNPAFGGSTDGTNLARAVVNAIADVTASSGGVPGYMRCFQSGGTTGVFDLTFGTDFTVSNLNGGAIVNGATITVDEANSTIDQPEA